jgi:LuxR family maltose regulon positive regulatory protein
MGDILLERNELEEAERHLRLGMQDVLGSLTVDADVVMLCHIALARCQSAGGDTAGALATLDSFAPLAQQRRFVPALAARVSAARARSTLARGNVAGAEAWASASGLTPDEEPSFPHESELLCLVRLLIAQGKPLIALRSLERLLAAAESDGRTRSTIEMLLLRSLAEQAAGDASAARAELGRALALAGPAGFVRLFVEEGAPMRTLLQDYRSFAQKTNSPLRQYAESLLGAFDGGAAPAIRSEPAASGLVERLSEREREVLQLIASGANNAEIASQLYLAVGTVKRHINNIFGKLGVSSRTQAMVRARELKLID